MLPIIIVKWSLLMSGMIFSLTTLDGANIFTVNTWFPFVAPNLALAWRCSAATQLTLLVPDLELVSRFSDMVPLVKVALVVPSPSIDHLPARSASELRSWVLPWSPRLFSSRATQQAHFLPFIILLRKRFTSCINGQY
jgi:hypothetical protein